jgi:hypothetical protein
MSKENIDFKIESFLSRKTQQYPELDQAARAVFQP